MVPAINIVFLLLIFFMIAGRIEATSDQLIIPTSVSETALAHSEAEIKIAADGVIVLNTQTMHSAADLLAALGKLALNKQLLVTCHIHKELPAKALDPVLSAVRKLGIKKLNIATQVQL